MLLELSTKFKGVFCSLSLNSNIWNEFYKNGPKNTIKYMTIMIISLIISFILLSLEDISGGNKY